MTYKGVNIGRKPTFDQLREYIKQEGLCLDAMDVYHYWEPRFWSSKKGSRVKSLELAVDVANQNIQRLKDKEEKEKQKDKKSSSFRLVRLPKTKTKKQKPAPLPKKSQKGSWMPYKEQLQDSKWKAFRTFIFAVRGHKCEKCGETTSLQIHHPKYISGRMAWEYNCKEVKVLCRKCHATLHDKPIN